MYDPEKIQKNPERIQKNPERTQKKSRKNPERIQKESRKNPVVCGATASDALKLRCAGNAAPHSNLAPPPRHDATRSTRPPHPPTPEPCHWLGDTPTAHPETRRPRQTKKKVQVQNAHHRPPAGHQDGGDGLSSG